MRLHVTHETGYTYVDPVRDSFNEARLCPVSQGGQVCRDFRLEITPTARVTQYVDLYQNQVHLFDVSERHDQLRIRATSVVETDDQPAAPGSHCPPTPLSAVATGVRWDLCHDFLQPSSYVMFSPELGQLARSIATGYDDVWSTVLAVTRHVHAAFRYEPNATHVNTRTSEFLQTRAGVCQDFAHVTLGLCRVLNIPARYVSGYVYNGPRDQLKGAQASHAWVEAYIPGHGWAGLDPTNDRIVDGQYVKIASGRDYADVSPVKGTYRGTPGRHMDVFVLVEAIASAAPPMAALY